MLLKTRLLFVLFSLSIFMSTTSKAAYVNNYSGDLPKTSSQVVKNIPNAYLYGVKGKRNLTLVYNSCDYIIQNYYDNLDTCSREDDCSTFSIPFPSNTQPIFQIYDQYYSNPAFANEDDNKPLKEFYGTCKFEPRKGYSAFGGNKTRTEKGWLKVGFNPTNSSWNNEKHKFTFSPAQSVVTASEGTAMFDASFGVGRCGYDGVSNVTNGDYRNSAMISSGNDISRPITWRESLDYIVAGQALNGNLGIYSTSSSFDLKNVLMSNLKGQLDSSTPMIVGECNSSCVDPSFEVYSIPSESSNSSISMTKGFSSQENVWSVKKINSFKTPREAMPDAVLFKDETVMKKPGLNQYGQQIFGNDKVLPGGSLFGYVSQYFFIR